jgi:RND family efflux transporter MFP subunit
VEDGPEGISFLKEQQWKILTRSEPVPRRRVSEDIRLLGTITAKPGSMASVSSPVPGRLVLAKGKPLPVPGQRVTEGESLLFLEPVFSEETIRLLEVEAQSVRAKAILDQARLSFERTRRLASENAKSPRELQEAEFQLKSAEAAYEASVALQATYDKHARGEKQAGSKLDGGEIELRSPISGVVSHVSSGLGERVSPNHILFTILNSDHVWIEARVPESRISSLQENPSASLRKAGEIPLRFVYAGMQIDPTTRTVPLVFEAENQDNRLRIGQTVEILVNSRRVEEAIAIPESAVVEEDGRPIAFVQLSGETFEKRGLTLGIRGGGYVQVIEGLRAGERVVTKGGFAIRLASVFSVIPAHGHAH